MTAKVIRLNQTNFHNFMDKIQKAYEENRLDDFICICSTKYPEGEETEDSDTVLGYYWFTGADGSAVKSLGLTEVMKRKIMDYYMGVDEEE